MAQRNHNKSTASILLVSAFVLLILVAACPGPVSPPTSGDDSHTVTPSGGDPSAPPPASTAFAARWAKTAKNVSDCIFRASAVDASGNVYTAGYFYENYFCDFGSGTSLTGLAESSKHPLVVKYDSAGKALWARTVTGLSGQPDYGCEYFGIAVDGTGNVYAAGIIGRGTYKFGSGVEITLGGNILSFPVLVKYDSTGNALWVASVESSTVLASFSSVCVENNTTNVYVCGALYGSGAINFGNNAKASTVFSGANPVLVKYDALGHAQWAAQLSGAAGTSLGCEFASVDTDGSGNVIVAGYIKGSDGNTYKLSDTVSVPSVTGSEAPLLVKYDNVGKPVWARTVSTGKGQCACTSLAVDTSGDIYAAGWLHGNSTAAVKEFAFAPGVSCWRENEDSAFVVKYSATGNAQWARTVVSGNPACRFYGIAVTSDGGVACAGGINGKTALDFGNGKCAAGSHDYASILLVRYDASGSTRSAQSTSSATYSSSLSGVAAGSSGVVYAVGYLNGEDSWDLGNGVTVTTKEWVCHPLLVKLGN